MGIFTMITIVAIVGMGIWFVLKVIHMAFAHDERMKRIKYGYPVEGQLPIHKEEEGVIDYTKKDREN